MLFFFLCFVFFFGFLFVLFVCLFVFLLFNSKNLQLVYTGNVFNNNNNNNIKSLLSQNHQLFVRHAIWMFYLSYQSSTELAQLINRCKIKGCEMGPWLVLVSPCLRENVVATCKNVSFLCSLDNLLQKNVIVFFFLNQISKWRSFEKATILTYFSQFLITREKVLKNSFSTYLTHIHRRILLTRLSVFLFFFFLFFFFLPYQFWKKKYEFIRYGFSLVWFLVLIRIRVILEQSIKNKMVSKI